MWSYRFEQKMYQKDWGVKIRRPADGGNVFAYANGTTRGVFYFLGHSRKGEVICRADTGEGPASVCVCNQKLTGLTNFRPGGERGLTAHDRCFFRKVAGEIGNRPGMFLVFERKLFRYFSTGLFSAIAG